MAYRTDLTKTMSRVTDIPLLEVVSRTDKGLVREINEDALMELPEYGIVMVADGMGGYNAGEVASQMAIESIAGELMMQLHGQAPSVVKALLATAVRSANNAIFEAAAQDPELEGMGSTVVVALFGDGRVVFAHVGDSRIYRLQAERLEQLTRDHSMLQGLVDDGIFVSVEEALAAGVSGNVLTRGLGAEAEAEVDCGEVALTGQELFLLCTDGLSNMVSDKEIASVMGSAADDLEGAADRLMSIALANGGTDNISLILARTKPE
jgi:protein phosphatase